MLFHFADEILIAACGVIKAMTLCKESITVRTSPPSATHVRAYMAVMEGEPSGTQDPTQDREGNPQVSPSDPHPDGRTPHQLQVNLGDLGDAKLQQLMEDLFWEVTLRELNAPQGIHCQPLGEIQ